MDRARGPALRPGTAGAAARRGNDSLEARLAHPAFDAVRPWLARLEGRADAKLEQLNAFAADAGLRVESGQPLRFVPPGAAPGRYGEYELRVFESGEVQTRPGNRHDFFNALAWLAFPRTKARLNALHAARIPLEHGKRGRFRDLLTLLDEGGAVAQCADPALERLVKQYRWKELFWDRRERVVADLRILVLGHAVLEQALEPWPGITCKAIFVGEGGDADGQVAAWLGTLSASASPRDLPPLPVFGYPGWLPASVRPEFYDDTRHFRPARFDAGQESSTNQRLPDKIRAGVGQAAAAEPRKRPAEESPGSAEQDAG